jgi:hypothetical protein
MHQPDALPDFQSEICRIGNIRHEARKRKCNANTRNKSGVETNHPIEIHPNCNVQKRKGVYERGGE